MKKNILNLLLLFVSGLLFSQTNNFPTQTSSIQIPTFSSPEVSKLFRYADFPNINSIGGTDIEIPIYTIKLDGIDIPVKLKYDTKGIKVADIASDVGLGWSLIYGGNIVKEVRDLDDFTSSGLFFDPYCHDFEGYMSEKYYRLSKGYFDTSGNSWDGTLDYQIDSSPDFYRINAPSLNDKFYMKSEGNNRFTPKFTENRNSKSEFVTLGATSVLLNTNNSTSALISFPNFTIKNGLGYEYFFNNLEGTAINFFPQTIDDILSRFYRDVTTYRLSEIRSPASSKKIDYVYENFENPYLNPTLNPNSWIVINDGSGGLFNVGTGPDAGDSGQNRVYNKIIYTANLSTKRIKTINFNEGSINFIYSTRRLDYDGNILSKIEIKNLNGQIIKYFDLEYSYFQPVNSSTCTDNYTCLRLRLDKIKDSSSGYYIFNYGINNSNGIFPKRTSSKIDFLGFFNDNPTDFQLFQNESDGYNGNLYPQDKIYYYPQLETNNYLPFQLNNTNYTSVTGSVNRSSNENSLIGLLTQVTYPTGGHLSISYENDEFNILNETYKLGSARIKKLSQVFNNGTILEKNYTYKLDDGKSSGQIAFFDVNKPKISLAINNTAYVLYSKVEEAITGNGKIINEYSNFNEYPDLLEQFNFNDCDPGLYNSPPCSILVKPANIKALKETKFPYINVMSQSHRRGLLTQKTVKNDLGETLNREIYKYKNYVKDSLLVEKFITDYKPERASCNFTSILYTLKSKNYIRTENSFLTKVIKESYLPNGMLTEESNYIYNEPYNLKIKNQNIISNGKVTETKYQYPSDLGQTWLTVKNILEIPLITTETFKQGITDQGKQLSKLETIYPISSGSISGEYALPLLSKSYNLDNISETVATYDKYDDKGNLQQYTTKDGISTVIIWGYNQTQPIAKIEGAKLTDIQQSLIDSIVGASNIDAQAAPNSDETVLLSTLNTFRNSLPNYQIATYTYDPLIGVRSITPPSGIRESYIYDSANRLQKVIDVNGKVLKEMKYNYKN